MKILDEITTIGPYTGLLGGVILDIGSPDIMKFPVSYMAEAGYWTQTDDEATNLRAYLLKGGFIIFDDFRGGDWDNFEAQMKRVLPDARMVELDITHPIFHAFFDVATLDFVQFYGRGEKPYFIGAVRGQRSVEAAALHRELQQRRRRVLGVFGHRLDAHRPLERGVQAGGQLHRVRAHALGGDWGLGTGDWGRVTKGGARRDRPTPIP